MDKSVQHRSILALPVTVLQNTFKGTWVDAKGSTITGNSVPMGVTNDDAAAGETVAVTVLGTASMDLNGIATAAVMQGDVICMSDSGLSVKSSDMLTASDSVRGIVLYDAAATGHAEVLVGQVNPASSSNTAPTPVQAALMQGYIDDPSVVPTAHNLRFTNKLTATTAITLTDDNFHPATGVCVVNFATGAVAALSTFGISFGAGSDSDKRFGGLQQTDYINLTSDQDYTITLLLAKDTAGASQFIVSNVRATATPT